LIGLVAVAAGVEFHAEHELVAMNDLEMLFGGL